MASLKPAKCFRKLDRAYTRQSRRKPGKGYVKGVPRPKITIFEMGTKSADYELTLSLRPREDIQIRHNALEAARVMCNKYLMRNVPQKGYFFKIKTYPHHVLREHSLATGAGADRFSSGMSHSFGRPKSTAARIMKDQDILSVSVNKAQLAAAKEALKRAKAKFPCACYVKGLE